MEATGHGKWLSGFPNWMPTEVAAGINGGNETDYTSGINWYLNPNTMVKMNFVHAEVRFTKYSDRPSSAVPRQTSDVFPNERHGQHFRNALPDCLLMS